MATGDKTPCRFCKNPYSAMYLPRHEEDCAMNPRHSGQPEILSNPILEAKGASQKSAPFRVKDVKEIEVGEDLKAFFKHSDGIHAVVPAFHGILVNGDEETPTLLITDANGLLLPPFMIPGFIRVSPDAEADKMDDLEIQSESKEPLPKPDAKSEDMFKRIMDDKKKIDG